MAEKGKRGKSAKRPQGDASTTTGTKEVDSKVKEETKDAFESKEAQDAQMDVSDTKTILDPMSTTITTTTIKSLSTSKRSTHALGSSTSESDEESRSDDSRQFSSAAEQPVRLLMLVQKSCDQTCG